MMVFRAFHEMLGGSSPLSIDELIVGRAYYYWDPKTSRRGQYLGVLVEHPTLDLDYRGKPEALAFFEGPKKFHKGELVGNGQILRFIEGPQV